LRAREKIYIAKDENVGTFERSSGFFNFLEIIVNVFGNYLKCKEAFCEKSLFEYLRECK
jgi:hypothetical protein